MLSILTTFKRCHMRGVTPLYVSLVGCASHDDAAVDGFSLVLRGVVLDLWIECEELILFLA